ncbi:hypothetical protein [Acetobacterium sp.]|uniref:hypothetical protein n=1 Tax=Acetobacterium sp. TaxID=1872094 RepID=UPI002F4046BE
MHWREYFCSINELIHTATFGWSFFYSIKPWMIQTIKYLEQEIPIIVKTNEKAFIINETIKEEPNFVFNGVGVGIRYMILINKKLTYLYQDKHSLKWHVYKEIKNTLDNESIIE